MCCLVLVSTMDSGEAESVFCLVLADPAADMNTLSMSVNGSCSCDELREPPLFC